MQSKLFLITVLSLSLVAVHPARAEDETNKEDAIRYPTHASASAGLVSQSKIGPGVVAAVSGVAPIDTVEKIRRGKRLQAEIELTTAASIQQGDSSHSLPVAHVEAGLQARSARKNSVVGTMDGYDHLERISAQLVYDRNLALDRNWNISGLLGAAQEGNMHSNLGYNQGEGGLYLQAGAGRTGNYIVPFAQMKLAGNGKLCFALADGSSKPLSMSNHYVCLDGNLGVMAGLLQGGIEGGIGAHYEYKISDGRMKSDSTRLSVGPNVSGTAMVDVAGGHSAGQIMFTATIAK